MNTDNKYNDTWNLLIKLRDTTKDESIKSKAELYLNQLNTSAGFRVKAEAYSFLQSVNAAPVIFETGATSHAVNDLILFTDNTRELAELRDKIYKELADKKSHPTQHNFGVLYNTAAGKYLEEIKEDNEHIMYMHKSEALEYRQLYANEFNIWKAENGYK